MRRRPRPDRLAARLAALAGLAVVPACSSELPPTGQIVLYLTTDAPLPPPAGTPALPDGPPALFDRVRIDVYRPGEAAPCDGCAREFSVDRVLVDGGQASIGIVPQPGEKGYRVRVRLFRGGSTHQGEPRADTSIDVTVALPAIADEGLVERTVRLPTDAAGHPVGTLEQPVDPDPGRPLPGLVGSWPGARRVPCKGTAAPDEVCVPGGAYWMGKPEQALTSDARAAADIQRLVVLSPFFLDRTEVTVAALRAAGVALLDAKGNALDPVPWSGSRGGDVITKPDDYCTYTSDPGPNDALAVDCVSFDMAHHFCESLGKVLPSEAQFEYAASGLASLTYVWGGDAPGCQDGSFGQGLPTTMDNECPRPWAMSGPREPGSGLRDRLDPRTGGVIVDLAGNVTEWMRDRWNRQDEPCWGAGVFHDPVCDQISPHDGALPSTRGGNWISEGFLLKAARREVPPAKSISVQIGFRCARPANGG